MLNALISLDADLASSIALRYSCHMAGLIDMKLHTIHVEEPESAGHSPGTGWVRRTWENAMVKSGEFEIAQLIQAEKASCPTLGTPRILVGDREEEILREVERFSYDIYIEGILHAFTPSNFIGKIRSRLYRYIPCPVIIVKNLVNLDKVAIILRDEMESKKLISQVVKIFKEVQLPLDLISCTFKSLDKPVVQDENSNTTLNAAKETLMKQGWQPENCRTMEGSAEDIGNLLRDYGLVVSPLHRSISKKSFWLKLLSRIPSPILLCWQ